MQYTLEQHEKAVEMLKNGSTAEEIAKELGRTRQSIYNHLAYHGYYFRPRPLILTQEQQQDIERMLSKGYSLPKIADMLGLRCFPLRTALKKQNIFVDTMPKRFWNEDRYIKLKTLVLDGKSIKEIAEYFGKSENAIRQRLVFFFDSENLKKAKYNIEHNYCRFY